MACTIDSRNVDEGFGGGETYKRKREQVQPINDANINGISSMEIDDPILPPAKRSAISSSSDSDSPASAEGTTFEENRIETAYLARVMQMNEEIRLRKAENMRKREEREKREKEKILLRSGTKPKRIVFLKKITKSKQNDLIFNMTNLSF